MAARLGSWHAKQASAAYLLFNDGCDPLFDVTQGGHRQAWMQIVRQRLAVFLPRVWWFVGGFVLIFKHRGVDIQTPAGWLCGRSLICLSDIEMKFKNMQLNQSLVLLVV